MKCLYLYGTSSAVIGHDLASKQLSLVNGSKVYYYNGTTLIQNPNEPLLGSGSTGSSPLRYFADSLAGLNGHDIGFSKISATGVSWHDGLKFWSAAAVTATKASIQPLLADGWLVKGIIAAIDGEFDSVAEINSFARREKLVMDIWRQQLAVPQVFLLQTENLPCKNQSSDTKKRLTLYRQVQAKIRTTDPKTTVILSNPTWPNLPNSSLHLNVAGMYLEGQAMATTVHNWNVANPGAFGG